MGTEYAYDADGTVLPLGDGTIRLNRIRTRDESHIRVYRKRDGRGDECLCVASGITGSPKAYRKAVTGWLREYARATLTEKVSVFSAQMQVDVNRIAIKEQKTRWASCSAKGNLNFNWKLVLMPECIQDYVVVHELAHRKQMNHSKAFWREVEHVLPDYRERNAWLLEHERDFLNY